MRMVRVPSGSGHGARSRGPVAVPQRSWPIALPDRCRYAAVDCGLPAGHCAGSRPAWSERVLGRNTVGGGTAVRFEILGEPRAWRGDLQLELGPGKQRAVLAVLLLNANRPVSPVRIVDAVWGDEPPENGTNVVQKYVAALRRVLEPDRSPRS